MRCHAYSNQKHFLFFNIQTSCAFVEKHTLKRVFSYLFHKTDFFSHVCWMSFTDTFLKYKSRFFFVKLVTCKHTLNIIHYSIIIDSCCWYITLLYAVSIVTIRKALHQKYIHVALPLWPAHIPCSLDVLFLQNSEHDCYYYSTIVRTIEYYR